MSVPERQKRMSQIPNGDERTNLSGRQHLVLYLGSQPNLGTLHLAVPVDATPSITAMPLSLLTLFPYPYLRPINRMHALPTTAQEQTGK